MFSHSSLNEGYDVYYHDFLCVQSAAAYLQSHDAYHIDLFTTLKIFLAKEMENFPFVALWGQHNYDCAGGHGDPIITKWMV